MLRSKKILAGVAALAALGLGGSAIAGAATSSSSGTTTQSPSSARPPAGAPAPRNFPGHGTAAHEDAEKPVTGAAAAKAQAAAVKGVSGTAGAVTTDFTGKGYEVTVTKSDGSKVEVHLDTSYNVMRAPGGPGARGGPAAPGGPGGPPPGGGSMPPGGYGGAPPSGSGG